MSTLLADLAKHTYPSSCCQSPANFHWQPDTLHDQYNQWDLKSVAKLSAGDSFSPCVEKYGPENLSHISLKDWLLGFMLVVDWRS
jgi:hypothetical protein